MKQLTPPEILNSLSDYLHVTIAELASSVGYERPQAFYDVVNKKTKAISSKMANSIISTYPEINITWLVTGIGDMITPSYIVDELREIHAACAEEEEAEVCYNPNRGVPYYNIDFIGGFDLIINDQTANSEYNINFKKYNDADCWCNITGHSMEPEITHGDIIALKKIEDWRTFLPYGEIYGIVTQEHRTIKRVTGSNKDGFLRLIPTNTSPEYIPQDIPMSVILCVYKVLGCMKRL